MKRFIAVIMAAMLIFCGSLTAFAKDSSYGGLNGNFKSSRSDFEGKGGLTKETLQLVSFDGPESWEQSDGKFNIKPGGKADKETFKEGTGSFTCTLSGGTYSDDIASQVYEKHSVFGGTPGFNFSVTDVNAQSIGFWLYVDDVDNLTCDHDKVYGKRQENCATLYFRIGASQSNYQQWNHTFYSNGGWQYIELAFATRENTPKQHRNNIVYENMQYMSLILYTKGKEVTVKVDDISLITYKSTAKIPAAPNNGRWISTCDYNAIDGVTVTEWMGAYYDTKNKTQGVSSLALHGRKEHVDFRETIGGFSDFTIDLQNDVFCADIYVEDVETAGSDWTIAFYDTSVDEQGVHALTEHIRNYCVGKKGLKNGWNTVKIPFKFMKNNGTFKDSKMSLHRIKIFVTGGDEKKFYNLAFDNMYIADAKDLGIALEYVPPKTDPSSTVDYLAESNKNVLSSKAESSQNNEEKENSAEAGKTGDNADNTDNSLTLIIICIAAAVVIIAAATVTVILIKRKKKNSLVTQDNTENKE